jgi:succinoglycan biosynthesis transport protein ExoP
MPDLESAPDASGSVTVSPFELLAVLWRRKLVVAVVVVITVVASVGLSLRSTKQYGASAQLLFRDPGFAQALFGNNLFSTGAEEPQRTTQTSVDVVSSYNVAAVAAKILKTKVPLASLVRSISVTPNANADIASVEATRPSPREAAAVANAFAEGYVTYRRQADREKVVQAEELVQQSIQTSNAAEQSKLEESLRQLGVLRALQTGDAEVIERAQPNTAAISPKPKRDALLGFIVGLLLGCALALLVDFLDRRLKKLEDFERACPDYSIIASVPHTPTRTTVAPQLDGPAGESYRMLREGMRFLDPNSVEARCYVITSADESEGKSTVAVNLAFSIAATGRRVVVLEADMHRPRATKLFRVERGSAGLSDLLVSDADPEDFLVPVGEDGNLAVLPSGMHPPNAADLLSAGRMENVLQRLRESADVVIVDSPPLLPVADARVLLRLAEVDGVILVGRAGVSRRDHLRAAKRVLAQSGRRVYGLVVTDVKASMDSSYYYYYADPDEPTAPAPRGKISSRV